MKTISEFDIYSYPYLNELKKETMKNIKANFYDFEDLASLIYIKRVISPGKDYESIRHVDEVSVFFGRRKKHSWTYC